MTKTYKTRSVIEITSDEIRIVQSVHKGRSWGIVNSRAIDINGMDDQAIAKVLRLKNSQIIAVISRQHTIVRYLELPSSDPLEIKQMVELQALSHVPYAREDVGFGFTVLGQNAEGKTRVMVVFIPQDILKRHWNIYTSARLVPDILTISSVGLWEWFKLEKPATGETVLLMHIENMQCEMCVCTEKNLLNVRCMPLASQEEWSKQIDLTMESYAQLKLGDLPSRIWLVADKNSLRSSIEELSQRYEVPVDFKHMEQPFIAGIGLALGDLQGVLNLIPDELRKEQNRKKNESALLRSFSALGFAIIAAALIAAFYIGRQKLYVQQLNNQWIETKKQLSSIDEKKAKIEAIMNVTGSRVVAIEIIDEVYRLIPQGVFLVNLSLSPDKTLSFQGVANNSSDINVFQENLVRSSVLSNVRLDFVNKRSSQEGEINYFKISCQVNSRQ